MQYQKITSGETIIEFHNNWLGEETVIIKGKVVSKQSSIWGTNHKFTAVEKGNTVRFVLTSKVDANMNVLLDLRRNGKIVAKDVPVQFGFLPKKKRNPDKRQGIEKLQEYHLKEALALFERALEVNPDDPEIFFHMACAHSVLEDAEAGFTALQKAIAYDLPDTEMILTHDMLAFLRLHPAFELFLDSGFKRIDPSWFQAEQP